MSQNVTAAPAPRRRSTHARPMPWAPPVTNATRPSSEVILLPVQERAVRGERRCGAGDRPGWAAATSSTSSTPIPGPWARRVAGVDLERVADDLAAPRNVVADLFEDRTFGSASARWTLTIVPIGPFGLCGATATSDVSASAAIRRSPRRRRCSRRSAGSPRTRAARDTPELAARGQSAPRSRSGSGARGRPRRRLHVSRRHGSSSNHGRERLRAPGRARSPSAARSGRGGRPSRRRRRPPPPGHVRRAPRPSRTYAAPSSPRAGAIGYTFTASKPALQAARPPRPTPPDAPCRRRARNQGSRTSAPGRGRDLRGARTAARRGPSP